MKKLTEEQINEAAINISKDGFSGFESAANEGARRGIKWAIEKLHAGCISQQEKDDIRFALVFTMKELDLNTGNSADKILSDRLQAITERIDNE